MPIGTVINWNGKAGQLQADDPRIPHVIGRNDIAVGDRFWFKIRVRNGRRDAKELERVR
jgi:hypothetical protein